MSKKEKAVILIVDDRPANLIALDGLLSSDERVLITAHSGKEALEITLNEKVDLILLDVQMPDMDGFEVAQILKSRKQTAEIPIIFASAEKLDHASRLKGFEEGAIDYLFKPLDPEITKAKVSVLLEVQRQKKLLIEKNALLEKAALLINNSADIIGIVDSDSLVIEEMNPAFNVLLEYEDQEFRGRSLLSFMNAGDEKAIKMMAGTEKQKLSFETRIFSKSKAIKWLDWNVVVKDGKWFVNARDITEIKHLNVTLQKNILQLEAANKELESFSYSVSHDLRAPLRALNGNAQILEEDYGDKLDADAKKVLGKIHFNVNRMDGLINDLLSFSRIGKKELRKGKVDMEEQVRNIFAEISQAQAHRAVIRIGALPGAFGDYSMLNQVWTNLISNAIKYSAKKENPQVEVGARAAAGGVEYYIKDNGAGFDMTYSAKLFGTFQRLHDQTEFEGTGIGLAIVKRIILKHGGTIRAEAEVEKGASFYFTIPPEGE